MLQLLNDLRAANFDRIDLEDAVALLGFADLTVETYRSNKLEPPTWMTDCQAALRRDVARRRRDNLEAALKSALARKEALRTSEEKRRDADAEIQRLQAAIGEATANPAAA